MARPELRHNLNWENNKRTWNHNIQGETRGGKQRDAENTMKHRWTDNQHRQTHTIYTHGGKEGRAKEEGGTADHN